MIIEGLVTTTGADGQPHLAPMGPCFEVGNDQTFTLRPFQTSQSYENLRRDPQGVFHITDDAVLMARAAINAVVKFPAHRRASHVAGFVLQDCCQHLEFCILAMDDRDKRVNMTASVVHIGLGRPWRGFNRARHALIEAAILATRVHLLPKQHIESQFQEFATIIGKTGTADEADALELLLTHVRAAS